MYECSKVIVFIEFKDCEGGKTKIICNITFVHDNYKYID